MLKRVLFGGVVTIGIFVAGFIFLLRSCLSKYDERSVISRPLLFEQNGKTVVFSLIKFEKTVSYEQHGGFINKSVNTSYNLQVNDAITGDKILEQPLKKHRDIKSYPIEIVGAANNIAWIFAGELMAFNPFTLEKIADTKILENRNPSLKGKLIGERKYYEFDAEKKQILVTVNDGSAYIIDAATFAAIPVREGELSKDVEEARKKELETALKKVQKENELVFERFRNNSKAFSQKLISANAYRDSSAVFNEERRQLDKVRDSIYALQRDESEEIRGRDNRKNIRESLERGSTSFGSIKSASDTFNNKWYGLYTAEELAKLWERFEHRSSYNDADRNRLYTASITAKSPGKKYSEWIIGENKQQLNDAWYLQGGFLLNKSTALPFHLSGPGSFLVVHKDKVGADGNILLSRIDSSGKQVWTMNTGFKELADWEVKGNNMIVTGRDNKALSSGEINVLHTVDLRTGKFSTYDFFVNKLRIDSH